MDSGGTASRRARVALLLACAAASGACASLGTTGDSGLRRTKTVKSAGGTVAESSAPIRVRESPSLSLGSSADTSASGPGSSGRAGFEHVVSGVVESALDEGVSMDAVELDAGPDAVWFVTSLRTAFRSASLPGYSFDDRLTPSARGWQASAGWWDDERSMRLGLRGGHFAGKTVRREEEPVQGTFVRETAELRGVWGALELRHLPKPWCSVSLATGFFWYALSTRLETNASVYEYDGVVGERILAAGGGGLGLMTPWKFPVRAGVEAMWWFTQEQDPPIEKGIAQVSARLSLRF